MIAASRAAATVRPGTRRRSIRGRWTAAAAALGALLAAPACEDPGSATVPAQATRGGASEAPIPEVVANWIDDNAHPFEGSHLSLPHTGLEFLRDLVGDARIVALGENTHGTRDFFEMKARILRFLVEEMGFEAFVIEATWPEARRLDHYVRTGEGDALALLSGLYFWTWRTESVLEMIEWMRDHNEAGGSVGFHGNDMQSPGMALHNVLEYFRTVDPDAASAVMTELLCLNYFANNHRGQSPSPGYPDQSNAYRTNCRTDLDRVRSRLLDKEDDYAAVSGQDAFEVALQSLRVALQYHLMISGEQGRDESMAENTIWIANQLGPESRVVVWAHNYHVSEQPGAQGFYMRSWFGDDLVILGFSHETGQFTAVGQDGSDYTGLDEFTLRPATAGSFERYLSSASHARFFLDLRDRDPTSPATSWLSESLLFRSIGCCYDPARPSNYSYSHALASWFDIIIHYEATRPTVLLPVRYLDGF